MCGTGQGDPICSWAFKIYASDIPEANNNCDRCKDARKKAKGWKWRNDEKTRNIKTAGSCKEEGKSCMFCDDLLAISKGKPRNK